MIHLLWYTVILIAAVGYAISEKHENENVSSNWRKKHKLTKIKFIAQMPQRRGKKERNKQKTHIQCVLCLHYTGSHFVVLPFWRLNTFCDLFWNDWAWNDWMIHNHEKKNLNPIWCFWMCINIMLFRQKCGKYLQFHICSINVTFAQESHKPRWMYKSSRIFFFHFIE